MSDTGDFLRGAIGAMQADRNPQGRRLMQQSPEAQERRDAITAALAHQPQIHALGLVLQGETPDSYTPGMDFPHTAYLEGRKAALRDLIHFLTYAPGKAA
jgi:hypothetical protein